jgi:ribosome-associated toxin RatA of RatAB toxin-antitoxin module
MQSGIATATAASATVATLLFFGLIAFSGAADGPPWETTVAVVRNGDVFEIEAHSRVTADRDAAWAVLTDYDGYAEFVPGMTSSRHLSEQPLRIAQEGVFGVLFLRKRIYSTLVVQEDPPSAIRFRSVEGNLRRLETEVRLTQDGDKIVMSYVSTIEPDFWVPPLIGTSIVRRGIRAKLNAVAEEIDRRVAREALE